MYATKEDALSPDELRKRLYQTFKNRGVLDTLKTQLRNQLIQELKQPQLAAGEPVPKPVSAKAEPLMVSVSNSIVADHLCTSGYEYTLSVFYPESGLGKDKVFRKEDLLHLLKISPDSPLYKSLLENPDNKDKGFLLSLLSQLARHNTQAMCHDADTQTGIATFGESLVEKMKMIDKEYESFSHTGDRWFSFQTQLATYRTEMGAQLETEMNTKLQHFKEVEIAKVRMEEKCKFQKEFDDLKKELERTYELKAKALMDREKNAIERLEKQMQIEEKNLYTQRQSVLREIEKLRNRENELRMKEESLEKTCQVQEEKVKTTEELLRRRELSIRTMEETYDQRLKNDLSRYQLELKEEYIRRTEALTESETRNKVETARIQRETAAIDSRLEEHSRVVSELRRLQLELDVARQQIPMLTQQKQLFQERLETMSDYTTLKKERAELHGQTRLLRKQLDEAQEENRLLHTDLDKPSSEHLALQVELRSLQSACRLKEEEFDKQKQVLQTQLQVEMERCAQLKAQLIECEEKLHWTTNRVEDLKLQLFQTQQALENEVLRNPKPSLVDRSVLEFTAGKLVPPDIYVDKALLSSSVGCDDIYKPDGAWRGHKDPWCESPGSDNDLVAEAMARFQELQKEAETLEEAYRNYQQRAANSTISHTLSPRSLSPRPSLPLKSLLRKQTSHRSQAHLPHNTKMTHKLPSPQNAQTSSSFSYKTRSTFTPAEPRVTFLDNLDPPKSTGFTQHGLHSWTDPVPLRDGHGQDQSSSPSRPLSSSSNFNSRREPHKYITEESRVSPVIFPDRTHDPQKDAVVTLGDFSPEFSPPLSPQLKSTTRNQSSPPKVQTVITSSESSPQPEKISLDDLTGILSEPSHIPELLLDTAVPLTAGAPDGPDVPRPQDLPEDLAVSEDQADVPETTGESVRDEDEEAEEQSWERERKERQERRQRELEEAKERELQELERLEKEELLKEVKMRHEEGKEEEEGTATKKEDPEVDLEETKGENPLEKYMKMVLEAREKQHAKSPEREEMGHTSPEDKTMSDEKEDSIAAYSHKYEDGDDDFW